MIIRLEVPENNNEAIEMLKGFAAELATSIKDESVEASETRDALTKPYNGTDSAVRKTPINFARVAWRKYLNSALKGKDAETRKAVRASVKVKFKVCNQVPDINKRTANVAYVIYDANNMIFTA